VPLKPNEKLFGLMSGWGTFGKTENRIELYILETDYLANPAGDAQQTSIGLSETARTMDIIVWYDSIFKITVQKNIPKRQFFRITFPASCAISLGACKIK
jgi:hypothetical protein